MAGPRCENVTHGGNAVVDAGGLQAGPSSNAWVTGVVCGVFVGLLLLLAVVAFLYRQGSVSVLVGYAIIGAIAE